MFSFVRNQQTFAPFCLPTSREQEFLLLHVSSAFVDISVLMWAVLITAQWGLIRCGFPGGSAGKVSAYSAGDPGSIQGLGRPPGEGNGNPLQYSGLENPMDCHKESDTTEQCSHTHALYGTFRNLSQGNSHEYLGNFIFYNI